jgi:hypothetical protein
VQPKGCDSLPKPLPGVVRPQWVRCGKPRCRCALGQLHGPYPYRFWREAGRLKQAYVRPDDLDRVRAQCQARQQFRREMRAWWQEWRRIASRIREQEKQ